MSASIKIHALNGLKPYLRLIQAYNDENFRDHNWRNILNSVFYAFCATDVIILLPIFILLAVWYLIENDADLIKVVIAVPLLATLLQMELAFITLLMKNRMAIEMIDRLQQVIDKRSSDSEQSHKIYANVEAKFSLFNKILVRIISITYVGVFLLSVSFPLSFAIFNYPPPQYWTLPLETHSLIGRNNCCGFLIDWFIELVASSAYFIIFATCGLFYVGIFLYIDGMKVDVTTRAMKLSNIPSFRLQKPMAQATKWAIYVQEVDFHVEIIGLAKSLRNMMGLLLFYITATCTIAIAFNLFVVELNDALSFETTIAIVDLYLILGLTFAYYFLADWITSDLLMIGDVFYNSRWYRLPPKQQKLLIFPIRRAQRVLRLKSLGIVDCSLPVFASICRSAGSYFLMMRNFE